MGKKDMPLAMEGAQLKRARGTRKQREIAAAAHISIGRYQNYERGANAPLRSMWPKLSEALGIDVGALYAPKTSDTIGIPVDALRPIIDDIKSKLVLLEALCGKTSSNKVVRAAGYSAKLKKREPA